MNGPSAPARRPMAGARRGVDRPAARARRLRRSRRRTLGAIRPSSPIGHTRPSGAAAGDEISSPPSPSTSATASCCPARRPSAGAIRRGCQAPAGVGLPAFEAARAGRVELDLAVGVGVGRDDGVDRPRPRTPPCPGAGAVLPDPVVEEHLVRRRGLEHDEVVIAVAVEVGHGDAVRRPAIAGQIRPAPRSGGTCRRRCC